jgi:hypothetical protein
MLSRDEPEPGREIPAAFEACHRRGEGLDRKCRYRTSPGIVCNRRVISVSAATSLIFLVLASIRTVFSPICVGRGTMTVTYERS